MSVLNELYKHLSKIIHGILRDMYDFTLGGRKKSKFFMKNKKLMYYKLNINKSI